MESSFGGNFRFALEGGNGAGKTSLLHRIQELRPLWCVHEVPSERWGFWGPDRIAQFHEGEFDSKTFRDLQKGLIDSYAGVCGKGPFGGIHIYERSPLSAARIFAVVNSKMGYSSADDVKMIQNYYNAGIRTGYLKEMDAMIYLRTPPEICRQRRLARSAKSDGGDGVDVNQNALDVEYEQQLYDAHEVFFNPDGTRALLPGCYKVRSVMEETYGELSVDEKADSVIYYIESRHFLKTSAYGMPHVRTRKPLPFSW